MSRAERTAVLVAAALALGAVPSLAAADDWAPTFRSAHVARVVIATAALSRPGDGKVQYRLRARTSWTDGSQRLLVLGSAHDSRGRLWLRVRLPIRPNTAKGWVNADHVRTTTTLWRVVIHTARRTVSVYRDGRLRQRFSAVVGKPSTPTPHGLFAVWERVPQPASSDLGPWALHLTAHSNVLFDFGGGPGRVALHGRRADLLLDPLGSARSHGCVRIDDSAVSWLASHAAPGTPFSVQP